MVLSPTAKNLLIAGNIWYFGEGMLGPLFAVYAQRVGGDVLDISWAWATYLMVTGLLYIVVGRLTDKRGQREKIMVIGYGLNALCTFAYLLVSNPLQLFLVQSGLGVAAALTAPNWSALYTVHLTENHEGLAWGLQGGLSNIITGAAVLIGGLIVTYYSFEALFITMGSIQVLATIIQAQILKETTVVN